MEAVVDFVMEYGGWGAWFLTVCFGVYMLLKGNVLSVREHEGRIEDKDKYHDKRIEDYQHRLNAEIKENEWLRDALLSSTEMGAMLTKVKTPRGGRRQDDEAE